MLRLHTHHLRRPMPPMRTTTLQLTRKRPRLGHIRRLRRLHLLGRRAEGWRGDIVIYRLARTRLLLLGLPLLLLTAVIRTDRALWVVVAIVSILLNTQRSRSGVLLHVGIVLRWLSRGRGTWVGSLVGLVGCCAGGGHAACRGDELLVVA